MPLPDLKSYRDTRVLITGGLGFIGSHLAAKLVALGANVTIIDSLIPEYGGNLFNVRDIQDKVRINFSDIRDPWSVRTLVADQDYVFNLAGQVSHLDSMSDPQTDLDINCRAQLDLLEAVRERNPHVLIVFAASRQQYGRPHELPVKEAHPMAPVDVNGINLVAGEAYHLLYHQVHGIGATSLRLTNTYGPHLMMKHSRQGFLPVFIRAALEGAPIRVFGDGEQLRDFTYISDCIEAFLAAGLTPDCQGRALNVGGLEPASLLEVANLCQELAGRGGTVELKRWPPERQSIDVGSVYLDSTALADLTGWSPRVALREGLEKTFAFYRRHGQHYWD